MWLSGSQVRAKLEALLRKLLLSNRTFCCCKEPSSGPDLMESFIKIWAGDTTQFVEFLHEAQGLILSTTKFQFGDVSL